MLALIQIQGLRPHFVFLFLIEVFCASAAGDTHLSVANLSRASANHVALSYFSVSGESGVLLGPAMSQVKPFAELRPKWV